MRLRGFPAAVAEERPHWSHGEDLRHRHLILVPFEDECAIVAQDAEAFGEALAQILAPIAFELAILLSEPSAFSGADQMRRIEHHQRERTIFERQRGEVRLDVGIDVQHSASGCAGRIGQNVLFTALVHEHGSVIGLVEPEHAATAAGVQHRNRTRHRCQRLPGGSRWRWRRLRAGSHGIVLAFGNTNQTTMPPSAVEMEIHEISPFKAGSIVLVLQAFWNLLYILFQYALFWTSAGGEPKFSVVVVLLMSLPLGWIGGATSAVIYNLFAGLFGGIRITVSIKDPTNTHIVPKQQLH